MADTNTLLDAYFNDPNNQTSFGQNSQTAQTNYTPQQGFDFANSSGFLNTGGFTGGSSGFNFDPTASGGASAFDSKPLDTLDIAAKQRLLNENIGQTQDNGTWSNIQNFLKQNSGPLFAQAFLGAGQGVLGYLAERRKARDAAAARAQDNQFLKDQRNADVARASAVPVVGSMINPNAPRNVGLLGQVKRA